MHDEGVTESALSPFFLLFVQNFLFGCAFNATSLLPTYLVSLGATQTFVGFFNTLGIWLVISAVVFFGRPLVGLPRVRTLRWGFFLLLVTSLLSWLFAGSLPLLAVLKLIGSLSWVFSSTLMMSLLFDLSAPKNRASSLALFSIGGMLPNPVTSLAGEAVLRLSGGPGLFLLAAGFALACWLWSLQLQEPPARTAIEEPQSFRAVVVRKDIRTLLILSFAFGTYYSAIASFLPHHTKDTLGEANLSSFLVPFSAVSLAIRLVLGKQFDRRLPRRFLYLSFLSVGVAMGLLLLPPSWTWIVLAGVFYGLGHSVLFPLMNTLFVQVGGEDQKAVYSNMYLVANLSGAVLMTPALGALGDFFGFRAIIAVLAVVALGCVVLVRSEFPRPEAVPPSGHSS
jgi:predicted MFS family arabinose efflux permease